MLPGKKNYTSPISKTCWHGNTKLEVVRSFCYLGDVTSESGGCNSETTSCIRFAWKKFQELILIVWNKRFSLANCGHIYNSCVSSVFLYVCETWPLNVKDLSRLSKADNSMVRLIWSVKISERYSMNELREKLKLRSVQEHIKLCHLRWFGHLTRRNNECWPKIMLNYNIAGAYPQRLSKKWWLNNINNDIKSLKIYAELAFDWNKWRKATQKKIYSLNMSDPQ